VGRDYRLQDAAHAGMMVRASAGSRYRLIDPYMRVYFDWDKHFALSLIPETARGLHDETSGMTTQEGRSAACAGRRFCSMNWSSKVDEFMRGEHG